ncbi:MAG TPA: relaxase, partial [Rhizobiales bacterium]|nr:relaxase [Hyphomicrobiales bacterium]
LARYLLAMRDNEHVELHEVSGFASDDLIEAFCEADAIAKGTRCKNYLFSISLNPPQGVEASTEAFEQAAIRIEEKLGLQDQPRAIVFHEKDGRRHAHVVWSRIDAERMRAINLPHYKSKLRDVSRELYLEHGWDMPRGLQDRRLRDPTNFSREEWQQAKRAGLDPREIKSVLRGCWESSDNLASFEQALKERGFRLARGDRRGFVAVDYMGEVYSLSRFTGVKLKELKARLGDHKQLASVEKVRARIAERMTARLAEFIKESERDAKQRAAILDFHKREMVARQHDERARLWRKLENRWQAETKERAQRLPRGISGIWHRLTGQYARIKAQNEQETLQAWHRDRAEKDALIFRHLEERAALQKDIQRQNERSQQELMQLRADVVKYQENPDYKPPLTRDREEAERQRRKARRRGLEP